MSARTASVARVLEGATEWAPASEVADNLLAALSTLLRGKVAAYVSTPITTGPGLLSWREGPGRNQPLGGSAHKAFLEQMVKENTERARPLVAALEARLGVPTIDPTRLGPVRGWQQIDYHAFWVRVIDRFVRTVAFVDGWQYSTGCVLEFEAAVDGGLTILDARLDTIDACAGLTLMRDATVRLGAVELDVTIHRSVLERMTERSGAA